MKSRFGMNIKTQKSPFISHSILDSLSVSLSAGCIIHCLFLPIVISLLPILEGWIEQAWVHKLMVLTAVPITSLAIFNVIKRQLFIAAMMGIGLFFLLSAAFIHAIHDYETQLTILGAVILASGHILRWHGRRA